MVQVIARKSSHSLVERPLAAPRTSNWRRVSRASQRLPDVSVACAVLVAPAPLLAAIALLILLDAGGPILYRREMIGLHGRLFRMYKFRTMAVNAEQLLLL